MKLLPELATAGIASLPTPLQELGNLSSLLGGPRIFVKRDDLTGLGMGGNKVRKLDFLMPVVLEKKHDTIVTGAYFQSNWCTAVAAAARKFGLKAVLVKRGPKDYDPEAYEGNHLLHVLLGAEILVAPMGGDEQVKEQVTARLRSQGRNPFLVGVGGNTPHGVAGYINAIKELAGQADERGVKVDYVLHASGSGGTQAGTVLGTKMYGTGMKVVCSSTGSRSRDQGTARVMEFVGDTVRHFGLDVQVSTDDVCIFDQYAGGYGYVTPGKLEAIKLLAQTEGLLIDPVYTASAAACLIDLCRKQYFKKGETVVFVHTGGLAGLFPYQAVLKADHLGKPMPWTIPPWHPSHET